MKLHWTHMSLEGTPELHSQQMFFVFNGVCPSFDAPETRQQTGSSLISTSKDPSREKRHFLLNFRFFSSFLCGAQQERLLVVYVILKLLVQ